MKFLQVFFSTIVMFIAAAVLVLGPVILAGIFVPHGHPGLVLFIGVGVPVVELGLLTAYVETHY
jgi:hypothetical protein